jgi:arabinan endo-1,5-alpha-L-arabinosidase
VVGGPSDESRPGPAVEAAAPDEAVAEDPEPVPEAQEAAPIASHEFDEAALDEGWSWTREPPADRFGLDDGSLRIATSDTDLYEDLDNAPVLLRDAPAGDYLLEAKVALDVPAEGCCHNFVQAGLVVRGDDDNYLKLVVVSIWETRQTEFAREMGQVPDGFPRYGSSVAGPPGEEWTWLRLEVRRTDGGEVYTAYTSQDGVTWDQGSTWTHDLGEEVQIGLLAMGGPGAFEGRFDYLRVHELGR